MSSKWTEVAVYGVFVGKEGGLLQIVGGKIRKQKFPTILFAKQSHDHLKGSSTL